MKSALKHFYKDAFNPYIILMTVVIFAGILAAKWLYAK